MFATSRDHRDIALFKRFRCMLRIGLFEFHSFGHDFLNLMAVNVQSVKQKQRHPDRIDDDEKTGLWCRNKQQVVSSVLDSFGNTQCTQGSRRVSTTRSLRQSTGVIAEPPEKFVRSNFHRYQTIHTRSVQNRPRHRGLSVRQCAHRYREPTTRLECLTDGCAD